MSIIRTAACMNVQQMNAKTQADKKFRRTCTGRLEDWIST